MTPTPAGWPRISPCLYYRDAAAMIDWLCQAFGFEIRLKVDDDSGHVEHCELTLGDGLIMVGSDMPGADRGFGIDSRSPVTAGCNTQNLMVFVDDVDAHCAHARAAGAAIVAVPELHDYGADYWADRSYGALDPEQHLWWFTQRIRG